MTPTPGPGSDPLSPSPPADPPMARTYLRVMAIEVLVLLGLWFLSSHFS